MPEKIIKSLINTMIFIGIFLLYAIYQQLIVEVLKHIGFDINKLGIHYKNICLIIIDISLIAITYLIYKKENNAELRRYDRNLGKYASFGLLMWTIGIVLMITTNLIIRKFYPSTIATNEEAVQQMLKTSPIYMTFSACIFAPFMEEMIFRKCIRKIFNSNVLFIIVSGLLFGLAHNLEVIGKPDMIYIIPYALFGSIFAYTYVKTKSIFVPMTFHFIHNTILVIFSLISMGVIK